MTRLAMSALLGHLGHLALASQSQIPLRVGDCVKATTELEFFFKDEGEYEKTHRISPGGHGVLLNIDSDWNEPSNVEFVDEQTREPVVSGAVFFHQFARVPWEQGEIRGQADKCLTVKDSHNGYQPVVKMSKCGTKDIHKWAQQFSFNHHKCDARPIRSTKDPSKCVDAVHPTKILLTDCSGVDSQKFLFRCDVSSPPAPTDKCYILAMGGRKDMCLWWDEAGLDKAEDCKGKLNTCRTAVTAASAGLAPPANDPAVLAAAQTSCTAGFLGDAQCVALTGGPHGAQWNPFDAAISHLDVDVQLRSCNFDKPNVGPNDGATCHFTQNRRDLQRHEMRSNTAPATV